MVEGGVGDLSCGHVEMNGIRDRSEWMEEKEEREIR